MVFAGAVGLLFALTPPASEATALAHQVPHYLHDLQDRNSQLGKFNVKYHVQDRLTKLLTSGSGSLVGGVIGAGALVIGTVSEILAIAVLSIYFLAGLPQIKLFTYRLIPHSRRPRAILIGDEIFAKVGGYMLGSFITAVIAGLGTYLWLLAWGVPYPLLLGTFVAFLDLIPLIGLTVGGFSVFAVLMIDGGPGDAIVWLIIFLIYQQLQDRVIQPLLYKGGALKVNPAVAIVAVIAIFAYWALSGRRWFKGPKVMGSPEELRADGVSRQKDRYLPRMAACDVLGAFALTEPEHGSDSVALETSARQDGDSWVLNGRKVFISRAHNAPWGIVFARTDKGKGRAGISCFILEHGTPGFHARPIRVIRTSAIPNDVIFEDCEIPAENLIGQEGQGLDLAFDLLVKNRFPYSACNLGIAVAAYKMAVEHAKDRVQFGRSIGSFPFRCIGIPSVPGAVRRVTRPVTV